jgi:UDP-N-acetylmuramoyl-tripeptide--D-alanyl-D-alanine ligase
MIPLPVSQVARYAGGALVPAAGPDPLVTGAAADSRRVAAGDLYVAIVGERVDGHLFADQAKAAGAVAVLGQRAVDALPTIVVADPVAALGRIAAEVLALLPQADVVAVTGSSGKTSTKDLIAAVVEGRGPAIAPVGSFNTEVGLPLTVLQADAGTRTLVLEMGARDVGHIAYLCTIARPRIGVLLNVGSAHLGVFGSRANIARAKSEIIAGLPRDGTAVLFADDPVVAELAGATEARVLTFGESPQADVRIVDLQLDALARPRFRLRHDGAEAPVQLQVHGEHQAANAAAAAAVGLALGMGLAEVAAALSGAQARSGLRMDVRTSPGGVVVVNDAYNANPESMQAALKSLAAMGRAAGARTWAVLGEMLELGADGAAEHDRIGRLAVRLNIDRTIAVGEGARAVHLGASHEGSWGEESAWVPDVAAAVDVLRTQVRPGDIVLVKASRGVALERVAEALLQDGGRAAEDLPRDEADGSAGEAR